MDCGEEPIDGLLFATISRDIDKVNELVQSGVDPCMLTKDGTSPIHKASLVEAPSGTNMVSTMLSSGADPNVKTSTGLSPLHIAAMWGRVGTIDILLDSGANVALKDFDDMSPLDYAEQAEEYRYECIDALTRYRVVEESVLTDVSEMSCTEYEEVDSCSSTTDSFWSVSSVPNFNMSQDSRLPRRKKRIVKRNLDQELNMKIGVKVNHLGSVIQPDEAALIVCDMQEVFRSKIGCFTEICDVAQRLLTAASLLDIPIIITEDFTNGRGPTVKEIDISTSHVIEKTTFSGANAELKKYLLNLSHTSNISHIILSGLEAHICVQQTAIDLMHEGYQVHVVADATGSRVHDDRMFAFERIRQSGGFITTFESILFMFLRNYECTNFRRIKELILGASPIKGIIHNHEV